MICKIYRHVTRISHGTKCKKLISNSINFSNNNNDRKAHQTTSLQKTKKSVTDNCRANMQFMKHHSTWQDFFANKL